MKIYYWFRSSVVTKARITMYCFTVEYVTFPGAAVPVKVEIDQKK